MKRKSRCENENKNFYLLKPWNADIEHNAAWAYLRDEGNVLMGKLIEEFQEGKKKSWK